MADRYSDIVTRCLAQEDQSLRDAILSRYDPRIQASVRHLMDGLAGRQAAKVRYAAEVKRPGAKRPEELAKEERIELRKQALEQIEPAWLRERVETMVLEQFAAVKEARRQMRAALEA